MTLNLDRTGWTRVRFGDVVRQVKEKVDPQAGTVERYVAGEHMDSDELHISRWGDVGDGYLGPAFHRRFRKGQILYGSRRTYLRKVAVAEFDGVCANTTYVMESKDSAILLNELLPFVMGTEAFHAHSISESKGSVNPYVNWPDIAKYEFDLPPLDQQQRIANLLWAVEGLHLALTKTLDSAVSARALRFHVLLDQANAVPIKVADLLREPPRNGISLAGDGRSSGQPTLSISSIRKGRIIAAGNLKYVEVDPDRVVPFLIEPGDFYVVRGNGNRDLVARGGLAVPGDVPSECFYPDLMIRLRFDPSKVLAPFGCELWNSPDSHAALLRVAKTTNGTYKINGADVKRHLLSVPSLEIQDRIMDELGCIDDSIASLRIEHESLSTLQKSLLKQFEGDR